MKLLDGVTADTDGSAFEIPQRAGRGLWHNLFSLYVWSSDFGGGTVTLQVSPDNGVNWFTARTVDEGQATTTISDVLTVRLRGSRVRAKLSGATSPDPVTVMLY